MNDSSISHLAGYQQREQLRRPKVQTFNHDKGAGPAPFKKKGPVGHDRQLNDMMLSGEKVTVYLTDGNRYDNVTIVRRCKFTITIHTGYLPPLEVILFKHAVQGIARLIPAAPAQPAADKSLD
jgi:sRNA-binding regulator protein Hfq